MPTNEAAMPRAAGPLCGTRVVELAGEWVAFAGRVLADAGAEVIRVVFGEDDPERHELPLISGGTGVPVSASYLANHAGKQTARIDPFTTAGRLQLRRLLLSADVVLEGLEPGTLAGLELDYASLVTERPDCILVSVWPYGQTGPHAHLAATDLTVLAMGHMLHLTGEPEAEPARLGSGPKARVLGGLFGALAASLALVRRGKTGAGAWADISVQAAIPFFTLETCGPTILALTGLLPARWGNRPHTYFPYGGFEAADGWVAIVCLEPPQWDALARWVTEVTGDEAILDEQYRGQGYVRQPHVHYLAYLVTELTRRLTRHELFHEGQRRGVPVLPVTRPNELLTDPQLLQAGYFRSVDTGDGPRYQIPGVPFRSAAWGDRPHTASAPDGAPQPVPQPPILGELDGEALASDERRGEPDRVPRPPTFQERDNEAAAGGGRASSTTSPSAIVPRYRGQGPLAGVRVIELGWYVAGPTCGRVLADMGAEVIKLETSKRPDIMRLTPVVDGKMTGVGYHEYGAGKRSVTVDLRTEEGRAAIDDLVRTSDVLTENFSREAIRRFGMDTERLHAVNPRLIVARLPAFGLSGPYAEYASYGVTLQALAGVNYMTGQTDSPPTGPSLALPDYLAGVYGATVVAMALEQRRRTGLGLEIELSQLEAAISIMGPEIVRAQFEPELGRTGNRDAGMAPHGVYPCAGEDRWCAIAVRDDRDWWQLVQLLGGPAWTAGLDMLVERKQHEDRLNAHLAGWTRTQDPWSLFARLQERGIPAGVVQNAADLLERDPQLRSQEYWVHHDDPTWGPLRYHPVPVRFAGEGSPAERFSPAVALGHSNDHVFGDLLGLSAEQLAVLVTSGAIQ